MRSFDKTQANSLYVLVEIWNILKKMGNFRETKLIAKFIYRLLDSAEVPNHLWIKGHIVCAKTLIHSPLKPAYDEAINLLKGLCQVLPPLPLPDNVYSIQKNLKLNDFPMPEKPKATDSLFSPAIDIEPDLLSKPAAVHVVNRTSQADNPMSESQGSGPVVTRVSMISVIDSQHDQFANELKELRRKDSADKSGKEGDVPAIDEMRCERPSLIRQQHTRRCSVFQQQMAVYEYTRNSRISSAQASRLARVSPSER